MTENRKVFLGCRSVLFIEKVPWTVEVHACRTCNNPLPHHSPQLLTRRHTCIRHASAHTEPFPAERLRRKPQGLHGKRSGTHGFTPVEHSADRPTSNRIRINIENVKTFHESTYIFRMVKCRACRTGWIYLPEESLLISHLLGKNRARFIIQIPTDDCRMILDRNDSLSHILSLVLDRENPFLNAGARTGIHIVHARNHTHTIGKAGIQPCQRRNSVAVKCVYRNIRIGKYFQPFLDFLCTVVNSYWEKTFSLNTHHTILIDPCMPILWPRRQTFKLKFRPAKFLAGGIEQDKIHCLNTHRKRSNVKADLCRRAIQRICRN